MNRRLTNLIRYFMDEWIPPAIRDTKWFMYPFYWYAYKGKNLGAVMDFKSKAYKMTKEEFSDFYTKRDTRFSNSRPTDLSQGNIDFIFQHIDDTKRTLLDVGCGSGYFLEQAANKGYKTTGCDVIKGQKFSHSDYIQANVEKLPIPDNSFDVVTCSHTLEHVIDFEASIKELKRVAKHLLIVVVPCQRSFYYTLDEHVRFFPYQGALEQAMKMDDFKCKKILGDLVFIGKIANQ